MAMEQDYWTQFEPSPMQQAGPKGFAGAQTTPPGYTPGEFGERGFPGPIIPGQDTAGGVAGPGMPQTQGGEWNEQRFTGMFGRPGTPQDLLAMETRLNAAGIQVLRNAAGVAGKIQLPNGQIVDIINAAGAGGRGFQWLTGDGGSGGMQGGSLSQLGGQDGYGAWTAPITDRYAPPTMEEFKHSPLYGVGLDSYLDTIEARAAASGTLNTGGLKRRLGEEAANYNQQAYSQWAGMSSGAFNTNLGIQYRNQDAPFNKMYSLAELGRPR